MGNEAVAIIIVGLTITNAIILSVVTKMYTEILKIEHVKNIGK